MMIIMQKNWLKTQFKKPSYTYSSYTVRNIQDGPEKLKIFSKSSPNIETAF